MASSPPLCPLEFLEGETAETSVTVVERREAEEILLAIALYRAARKPIIETIDTAVAPTRALPAVS